MEFESLSNTEIFTLADIGVRLVAAAGLGMLIGIDREARGRAAGLRTQMLVSVAAAMFTLIALELTALAVTISEASRPDPVRIIEAVVAGVAFLGAGTIIQARGSVRGITTGAGLWMSGAVGVACGAGFFAVAGTGALLAMVILRVIGWIADIVER